MAWQDIPKPQRLGILIGVPVLITAVFGYLAYQELETLGNDPLIKKYASFAISKKGQKRGLWAQIKKKEQEYVATKRVADRLPEVKERLALVKSKQEELRSRLPTEKQKTEVRVLIEDMARQITEDIGRIELVSVTVDERGGGGGGRSRGVQKAIEEVVYRCQFTADMNGLIYYINRLENSTRFMALSNLRLGAGDPFVDDETIEVAYEMHKVDMSIKTYVYSEGE